jgi:phosphate transport system substrate-binding protein
MLGFWNQLFILFWIAAYAFPCQAKLQAKIVSYPIANSILSKFADAYGSKSNKNMAPLVVEGIGVRSITNFCSVGQGKPDVLVANRRLTASDFQECSAKNINDLVELELGHGAVVVLASPDLNLSNLSAQDLYLAITKLIYQDGRVRPNSVYTWSELSGNGYDLPAVPIKALIPGANADLRDVFEDRILVNGCQANPRVAVLRTEQPKLFRDLCLGIRSDRAVEDLDSKRQNSAVGLLDVVSSSKGGVVFASPDVLLVPGIDKYVVAVDGHKPTYESIRDDSYPLSTPIYIYVKLASLQTVKSLKSFLRYIFSAQNEAAHLSESAGFLSLDDSARARQFEIVNAGWANFQLEKADFVDKAIAFVKNPGIQLPESPAEPEMPHTFVGTPLDKAPVSVNPQDFDAQAPTQMSSIDDQLQQPGLTVAQTEPDVMVDDNTDFGGGFDVPAEDNEPELPGVSWKDSFR